MPLRILISGSSGLVGTALIPYLQSRGHGVTRLVRNKGQRKTNEIFWDPIAGVIDQAEIENFDAVIHLAGENIAGGRWSTARKRKMWDSRVCGTKFLSCALAACKSPPRSLISASAIGFYGNRGTEICTENSPAGTGFLVALAQQWETATKPAEDAGIRVVLPRFSVVLSPEGGALKKMLPIFKLGLGGKLGSGDQYLSWIELSDLVRLLDAMLLDETYRGPINCVAPHPVTNAEFTTTLGRALKRPTPFPVPAFVLRLALGEMADEMLLASTRVASVRIPQTFEFTYPTLEVACAHFFPRSA